MTREEANAEISALVEHAYETIRQAERLADEHNLEISFSVEYGMGGYYSDGVWTSSSADC